MTASEPMLIRHGYEPDRVSPLCIRLRSCPFHPLNTQAPDLVCGLNREFVDGILRGLGNESLEAVLQPTPGECCVKLRPKS